MFKQIKLINLLVIDDCEMGPGEWFIGTNYRWHISLGMWMGVVYWH